MNIAVVTTLNNKLYKQYNLLESSQNKMSSTDGLVGQGVFDPQKKYKLYNQEFYFKVISKKYKNTKFLKRNSLFTKFE